MPDEYISVQGVDILDGVTRITEMALLLYIAATARRIDRRMTAWEKVSSIADSPYVPRRGRRVLPLRKASGRGGDTGTSMKIAIVAAAAALIAYTASKPWSTATTPQLPIAIPAAPAAPPLQSATSPIAPTADMSRPAPIAAGPPLTTRPDRHADATTRPYTAPPQSPAGAALVAAAPALPNPSAPTAATPTTAAASPLTADTQRVAADAGRHATQK